MPKLHGQLTESTDVLRATLKGNGITLHGGGVTPMLYELARPSTIARGMHEMLTNATASENPVAIFADQGKVWWHPPKYSKKQETK